MPWALQVTLIVYGTRLVDDCDKLQAMFDEKVKEVGEVTAAIMFLQACCSIQSPTIGAVEEGIVTHHRLDIEIALTTQLV